MSKSEIVNHISKSTGLTKSSSEEAFNCIFSHIAQELSKGNPVVIHSFGAFKISVRKARKARNPRTGEVIDIPEKLAVRFVAHKGLKESLKT